MGDQSRQFRSVAPCIMRSSRNNNLIFLICMIFMSSWNMLKVQCQEADLLTELNAIEEDQVAKDYVEEEVDAVVVEDVQEEGIGNADIDVDEVKVEIPKADGLFKRFAKTLFRQNV